MDESCLREVLGICFVQASGDGGREIFGIADFLATVAIFVVAYSLSDATYKFRSAASVVPYRLVLFFATLIGGFGLILSDIWFSLNLPIPRVISNHAVIQIVIAALLIAVLSLWMFRSFVHPPRFNNRNAIPFARQVFRSITDGDEAQLAACVNEVGRSARELVREASRREVRHNLMAGGIEQSIPETAKVAAEILSLLGDRRFCRMVASRMPWVATEIFRAAAENEADVRHLAQFTRNVSDEFFADTESAVHHEDDYFYSGLIGHIKPVSSTMFGNSRLIEKLSSFQGSPLYLFWLRSGDWKLKSWRTYNQAVLLYLADKLEKNNEPYVSTDLYQVFSGYKYVCNDLHLVNDMDDGTCYQSLPYLKFNEIVNFLSKAVRLLEKHNVVADRFPSTRDGRFFPEDIYDHLASIALELFSSAGAVDTSDFRNWSVQHNTLWSGLISAFDETGARTIFRKRLQRVIWSEVSDMSLMPNHVGAHILSVCLNVLGFKMGRVVDRPRESRAFKRLIVGWTRRNFLTLYAEHPKVAQACIGGTITFDEEENRLVKTYRAGLGREPAREYLHLDPPRAKLPPKE